VRRNHFLFWPIFFPIHLAAFHKLKVIKKITSINQISPHTYGNHNLTSNHQHRKLYIYFISEMNVWWRFFSLKNLTSFNLKVPDMLEIIPLLQNKTNETPASRTSSVRSKLSSVAMLTLLSPTRASLRTGTTTGGRFDAPVTWDDLPIDWLIDGLMDWLID